MSTIKQERAVKNMSENGGNISKAMRDAGYTDVTAATPKKLTNSKGWHELMEKYYPDELLAQKHNQLLEKKEKVIRNNNKTGKLEVVETGEIDATAVSKGLDMAYKIKKKYEMAPGLSINIGVVILPSLNEGLLAATSEAS